MSFFLFYCFMKNGFLSSDFDPQAGFCEPSGDHFQMRVAGALNIRRCGLHSEPAVFAYSGIVKRQYRDVFDPGKGRYEGSGSIDIFGITVNAWNDRDTHLDYGIILGQQLQIIQDPFIGHTGKVPMFGSIHELQVIQKQIRLLGHFQKKLAIRIAGSVYRSVKIKLCAGVKER